ncbi:MAG TPA: thiosulfate oxidation carrier complex protein SoxZ [Gemmatimonadaceae bacterium]|nr:thiosulfate oxidation carrier complex protein SoxZ [Gemmatimonadaceae bacterium]
MPSTIGEATILLPQQIARDAVINVRAILTHPMFTGMSRDPQGSLIPAFWVNEVVVRYGDREVARFQWTSGISRDPYVAFALRATHEAPLTVTWKDTGGGVYSKTADIKFSA